MALAFSKLSLACPARFERATYALEAVKMMQNNKLHNSISSAGSGVLRIEIIGVGWNSMDPTWHWQVVVEKILLMNIAFSSFRNANKSSRNHDNIKQKRDIKLENS